MKEEKGPVMIALFFLSRLTASRDRPEIRTFIQWTNYRPSRLGIRENK